jgi:hypothetical protein
MVVTVGDAELPELIRHSHDYAHPRADAGEHLSYLPVPGADHFSILYDLADPDGLRLKALAQLMQVLKYFVIFIKRSAMHSCNDVI